VIPFAHVGGVPVEELMPSVAVAGASLLAVRAWLAVRLRGRRRRYSSPSQPQRGMAEPAGTAASTGE